MTFDKRIPQDTRNLMEFVWLPTDCGQEQYTPILRTFRSKATKLQSGRLGCSFEHPLSSETDSIENCVV